MLAEKLEGLISLVGRLKLYNTLNSISFSALSKKYQINLSCLQIQ